MVSNINRAIKCWFKATLKPREVIEELQSDAHKVVVSFWIAFLFSLLYSTTAFLLYIFRHIPTFPPWIPIDIEVYYLYQTFWTVPWGLATWIMISGIGHLLSIAGRKDVSKYKFEDALAVCSVGFVVPWTFFTWIPETFIVPFFGIFWPLWIELLRVMVFPTIWQVLLITVGLRKTHDIGWIKGIGIGILTVITFFIMFVAFMR